MMESWFSCKNLVVGYGSHAVLSDLTFEMFKGRTTALIGANGSGKTTLIKSMLGLLKPLSGSAELCRNHRLAYIPQANDIDELFPFTVRELVEMTVQAELPPMKRLDEHMKISVKDALLRTGLSEEADSLFSNLSGGQKQRAVLAQGLAKEPDIMFLDEPTRGLDLIQAGNFLETLKILKKEKQITMVLVSHVLSDFYELADDAWLVANGGMHYFEKFNADSISEFMKRYMCGHELEQKNE